MVRLVPIAQFNWFPSLNKVPTKIENHNDTCTTAAFTIVSADAVIFFIDDHLRTHRRSA